MVKSAPRKTLARAWLAIVLSYVLGLNAFVLVATPSAHADVFGVICSQDRSAPNQPDRPHKAHSCCTAARCGGGAFLLGPPPGAPALAERIAGEADRFAVGLKAFVFTAAARAFEARGPPTPV